MPPLIQDRFLGNLENDVVLGIAGIEFLLDLRTCPTRHRLAHSGLVADVELCERLRALTYSRTLADEGLRLSCIVVDIKRSLAHGKSTAR